MELFPISSGGGQFTFVPLTLWYKFATRGVVGFLIQIVEVIPVKSKTYLKHYLH